MKQELVKPELNRAISIDRPGSRALPTTVKSEVQTRITTPQKPGYEFPEVHTSTVDVNGLPVYAPAGKPITDLDFDAGKLSSHGSEKISC